MKPQARLLAVGRTTAACPRGWATQAFLRFPGNRDCCGTQPSAEFSRPRLAVTVNLICIPATFGPPKVMGTIRLMTDSLKSQSEKLGTNRGQEKRGKDATKRKSPRPILHARRGHAGGRS